MEENKTKPSEKEVEIAIKKMVNLNELFLDSVKFNKCDESYEKYQYVSLELRKLIWILIKYFDIDC